MAESDELSPDQWTKAVASNPSFAFLHDAEEDIYTLVHGIAVSHEWLNSISAVSIRRSFRNQS